MSNYSGHSAKQGLDLGNAATHLPSHPQTPDFEVAQRVLPIRPQIEENTTKRVVLVVLCFRGEALVLQGFFERALWRGERLGVRVRGYGVREGRCGKEDEDFARNRKATTTITGFEIRHVDVYE